MSEQAMNPKQSKPASGALFWLGLTAALFLIGTTAVFQGGSVMSTSEDRAAGFLMMLGPAQLAYQDANLYKDYGTFTRLQNSGYIPAALTPETAATGYRIAIQVVDYVPLPDGRSSGLYCYDTSFTMVALPRNRRLRTFAMCDDQTLRYCTDRPDALPCTWPPVEREVVARLKERITKETRK